MAVVFSIHCKHIKGSEKMDWIQGIQRAIDYMEENMAEEIDFDEVAQQAYASSFHFQRVFGIVCGFSQFPLWTRW